MRRGVVERGASMLDRLNTREKLLLLLMIVLFAVMGTIVFVMNFNSSLENIDKDIVSYDRALTLLLANQEDFAERVEQSETIEEQLRNNTLQLRGFLERECIATNVDRPSSYSDNMIPQRDQSTGEARIMEHETRAVINAVEPLPLSRLLHRIANSDELVVLKAIDLQPARGQAGRYRVELTVSTYRLATDS